MAITNGHWRRIGDNPLGFGLARFEDGEKNSFWRLRVTRHHGERLVDIDCRASDLKEIKRTAGDIRLPLQALMIDEGTDDHCVSNA